MFERKKNNYFVEGLQGAGKTTFVQKLSDKLEDYQVFREGDFSPVELAWCASSIACKNPISHRPSSKGTASGFR